MQEHPDPNLISALIDGTLAPGQRDAVEAHLAACIECRALVADVASEARAEPRRARRAYAWRAGAAVLLAGIAAFLLTPKGEETPGELMAEAVRALADRDPSRFGSFEPLSEAERLEPSQLLQRGGLVLLHPTGKCRDPVAFDWAEVTGATGYVVSLMTADGMPLWEQEVSEPRLERSVPAGRYMWSVASEGPAQEDATRVFEVADAQEIADLDASLVRIGEAAAPEVRDLLRAQFCIRQEFYVDAERWARAAVARLPGERIAAQTLHCVLNRIGSPEADAVNWK